jgi:probable HAF family extracellular repeat protein
LLEDDFCGHETKKENKLFMRLFIASVAASLSVMLQANAGVNLIDLGTGGGSSSYATGINELGEIVGFITESDGEPHAFRYSNHTLTDLNPLDSTNSIAAAVNDLGKVVGTIGNPSQAVLFGKSSTKILEQGANYSHASGINNMEQIVGVKTLPDNETHAFLYKNALTTDLGTLGGDFSEANGINNRGEIVGISNISSQGGAVHPFLYSHGLMHDLGTLGGSVASANAINDVGEIVGDSTTTSNLEMHPFLYSHGRMHDLGTLGGSYSWTGGNPSYASAINNRGQVVGQTTTADGSFHAFLYHNKKMVDLNSRANLTTTNGVAGFLVLITATGINDREEIVGAGAFWDGEQITDRAFLLKLH